MTDETPVTVDTTATPDTSPETTEETSQTISMPTKAFNERLARAQRSAITDFLKEIGFEKPDQLKTALDAARKREQAEMSDAERLKAELETERQKSATALEAAQRAETRRIEAVRNSAIHAAAIAANAKVPDDVLMWASSQDLSAMVDEDGKVDSKAIAKLIDTLKKERAHWFGNGGSGTPGSPSNAGGTAGNTKKLEEAQKRATLTNRRLIRG